MKTIAEQLNITKFPFIIKDKRGNQIYYEDSNGYWSKWEYDSNGKETYYENSNGYWIKSEYDSNGKETYYENYYGEIIDNRPKSTCNDKVVEIDGKKYKLIEI
jgi:hypothetical protein